MIRGGVGIESWETAQSFRLNGEKLKVARVDADIFHYGWVRPPRLMFSKQMEFITTHKGQAHAREELGEVPGFDYGSLERLTRYTDPPPAVMKEWIDKFDWQDQLQYEGEPRVRHKHDRLKYRFLTFVEQKLMGGRQLGGFKNWVELNR